ncbi:MAG: histidine kinase [Anaerolineales bacterium]|jgi:PAS domain S-box-containing protein
MTNRKTSNLLDTVTPGHLRFGDARMALLDIESGFWSIRKQVEALIGSRLTNSVLQQAGANGGASFATSFGTAKDSTEQGQFFESCVQAYQTAGFGRFEIEDARWPIGRVIVRVQEAFEAWMMRQHRKQVEGPVCAYTTGVLVGFVNVVSDRQDVVCIEHRCQALGDDFCEFELLPVSEAGDQPVVAFTPDPTLGRQLNLLEMLFERMPMGIAVIDRDYKLVRTNPTWAAFIEEYTPSKAHQVVPGAGIFDLEPGTEETLVPLFKRVFTGETIRQDAIRIESGGTASFWDILLSPLYEGERVVGILNVSIDATERVRAEVQLKETLARLAESESMLRSVIENAQHFAIYRVQVDVDDLYFGKVVLVSPSIQELLGVDDPYDFSKWFERLHLDDYDRVVEANRRSMEEGIPYNQPARIFNEKEGRWHWVQTISNPGFDAEGRLTHFDGMIIDLTDQKEAELALQEINATLEQRVEERTHELKRRQEIAESMRDIIGMINSRLSLDVFLDRAVRLAAQRIGAAACVLHQFDLENQMISQVASFGMVDVFSKRDARHFDMLKPSGGEDYLKATLQRKPTYTNYPPLPERVDEIKQDPSIPEEIKIERIALRQKFTSSFSVPIYIQDKVYGGMVFYYTEPQEFSDEQIQLGLTFGEQVSLAIENARLHEQAEQVAVTQERNRLARDLHDAVSQTLFSASLIADVLPKLWDRDPETGKQKLDELRLLTRGALSEMRTLLLELRPTSLSDMDLEDLLRHLTNAFTGRTQVRVELVVEGLAVPSPEIKEVFYRVAQEALNNITKHAEASQVSVHLHGGRGQMQLEILDDGRGFDPQAVSPENLGLGIMHERAESIGAELNVISQPGQGTKINLFWKEEKE